MKAVLHIGHDSCQDTSGHLHAFCLAEASRGEQGHWPRNSEVSVGPPRVHIEGLPGATVFLHDKNADPFWFGCRAGYHDGEGTTGETAVLLPDVAQEEGRCTLAPILGRQELGQHARLILLQRDEGPPERDKDSAHQVSRPCTVKRPE